MVTTADPVARVVRNGSILILGRLVSLAAGVVTLPILFGGLGAHAFGVWVLLSGLAGILGYVDLGLGSALIREVARGLEGERRRRARAVQLLCVLWSLGFGGLVFVLGTMAWPLIAALLPQLGLGTDRLAIGLILLSSWIGGLALPWRSVLEGTQRYFVLAGIECGAALLTAAISIRVAIAGGGPAGLAAGAASVAAIRTIVVAWVAHCEVPALTPSLRVLRWPDVIGTLRYGLRVQATRLATMVNFEADRINLAVNAASVLTCAEGEPGRETRYAFFAAGLNLVLTYPCLKLAGPVGVPLSTAVAAAVASVYFVVHVQRRSGRPVWPAVRILVPPAGAALVAAVVTFAVAGWLPDGPGRTGAALAVGCRGGLAAVVVLAVLAAVRYVDATDLVRLRRVLGSRGNVENEAPAPSGR